MSLGQGADIVDEGVADVGAIVCDPLQRYAFLLVADAVDVRGAVGELIGYTFVSYESNHFPALPCKGCLYGVDARVDSLVQIHPGQV